MTANSKTRALFARTLRKYKKRLKYLERNMNVFEEFLKLDQEKTTKYLEGVDDFSDEFLKLEERLEKFKDGIRDVGGNPIFFDHEVDRLFFDVNLLKDFNENCK